MEQSNLPTAQVNSRWRAWTDATTKQKATRVFERLQQALNVEVQEREIEEYYKGGYLCTLLIPHRTNSWAECVLETITLGQRVSYEWVMTGDITEEMSATSKQSRISGITFIHLSAMPPPK